MSEEKAINQRRQREQEFHEMELANQILKDNLRESRITQKAVFVICLTIFLLFFFKSFFGFIVADKKLETQKEMKQMEIVLEELKKRQKQRSGLEERCEVTPDGIKCWMNEI